MKQAATDAYNWKSLSSSDQQPISATGLRAQCSFVTFFRRGSWLCFDLICLQAKSRNLWPIAFVVMLLINILLVLWMMNAFGGTTHSQHPGSPRLLLCNFIHSQRDTYRDSISQTSKFCRYTLIDGSSAHLCRTRAWMTTT